MIKDALNANSKFRPDISINLAWVPKSAEHIMEIHQNQMEWTLELPIENRIKV